MASRYIDPAPWDENNGRLWDKIEIAGKEWPGMATVDVVRANKWDTKKAKGKHGGEREFNGADLAKVKIQIQIWTTEHYSDAIDLLPDIEPNPGKETPSGVSILHPVTTIRKCPTVTIDTVSSKVTDRMMVIDIDATEHRPPDAKNASGTASGAPKGAGCDALQKYYFELLALNNTYAAEHNALTSKVQSGSYFFDGEGPTLTQLLDRIDAVEVLRVSTTGQIAVTLTQMNALNCSGKPPSAGPATTQP